MAKSIFKLFSKDNDKNVNYPKALEDALRAKIMEELRHEEVMDDLKEKRRLLDQYGEKNKEYYDHVDKCISLTKEAADRLREKDLGGMEYMDISLTLSAALLELIKSNDVHNDMLKLFDGM